MHWLITRPEPDAEPLAQAIRSLGGSAIAYPAIQIEPIAVDHRVIMDLDRFDTVIVVSKSAARRLIEEIDEYWPQLPVEQDCIAVGPGTAEILAGYGFAPRVPVQTDSEGVLELCANARRVLLAAGEGGRELIEQGLEHCELTRLALYRRAQVQLPPKIEGDVVAWVTSADIAEAVAAWSLGDVPVWVPSARVAERARQAGLNVQRILPSAQDSTLLQAIKKEAV